MCHLFLTIWFQIKSMISFSRSFMRYEKIAQILVLYEASTRLFTHKTDAMFFKSAAFHAWIWLWKSCFTWTQTMTWKSQKYSAYLKSIEHLISHASCREKSRRSWSNQLVWLVLWIIKTASKFENFMMKFQCCWEISVCLISLSNFLLSFMTLSAVYEE